MKLKSVLNLSTAVKIEIYDGNKSYKVDYLSEDMKIKDYGVFAVYPAKSVLPKSLLSKEVESIDVNNVAKALSIRVK